MIETQELVRVASFVLQTVDIRFIKHVSTAGNESVLHGNATSEHGETERVEIKVAEVGADKYTVRITPESGESIEGVSSKSARGAIIDAATKWENRHVQDGDLL